LRRVGRHLAWAQETGRGERIAIVRLDAHTAAIAVCLAEAGRDGEVRFAGEAPDGPAGPDG
jgi:hypothetical protein